MEVKLRIRTPEGLAQGYGETTENISINNFEKKIIRKLILSKGKIKEEYVNENKSEIFWVVDIHARHYGSMVRNVSMFSSLMQGILNNKLMNGIMNRVAKSQEDVKAVKKLLTKGTTIEIVKMATQQELDEAGKTFWQRVKEKFKKSEEVEEDGD